MTDSFKKSIQHSSQRQCTTTSRVVWVAPTRLTRCAGVCATRPVTLLHHHHLGPCPISHRTRTRLELLRYAFLFRQLISFPSFSIKQYNQYEHLPSHVSSVFSLLPWFWTQLRLRQNSFQTVTISASLRPGCIPPAPDPTANGGLAWWGTHQHGSPSAGQSRPTTELIKRQSECCDEKPAETRESEKWKSQIIYITTWTVTTVVTVLFPSLWPSYYHCSPFFTPHYIHHHHQHTETTKIGKLRVTCFVVFNACETQAHTAKT